AKVSVAGLYDRYKEWAQAGGEYVLSQRKIGSQFIERGFEQEKGTGGVRFWRGLGLVEHNPEPEGGAAADSGTSGTSGAEISNLENTYVSSKDAENHATNATC